MAWSWSHTAEAYADAEANLRALPLETLREIRAEWDASDFTADAVSYDDRFRPDRYPAALKATAGIPADALADEIWNRAADFATCDSGGFNAWLCPYGCGPHTVPFNR